MVIVIVIMASCVILVGISYFMLDILSGLVVVPKTQLREVEAAGEMILPLQDGNAASMQVSADGRYLAYIERSDDVGGSTLNVVSLNAQHETVFSQSVKGDEVAWIGNRIELVYEDGGDIYLLVVEPAETRNLTESPEVDLDPLPSPDGRYILWSRSPEVVGSGETEFWMMDSDGSDKIVLAPRADLPTWDPAGGKVASRQDKTTSLEEEAGYYLQYTSPGQGDWLRYVDCEGSVRYIWWPLQTDLFYVSVDQITGQDAVKGIWFLVEDPDNIRKIASTDGLADKEAVYRFYSSREGERLAYVGDKGLEFFDYDERVIYRYPLLDAEPPLAWDETGGYMMYAGPDGIYRVELEGK